MHHISITRKSLAQINLAQFIKKATYQQQHPPLPISLQGDFEWFREKGIYKEDPRYYYEFEEELNQLQLEAEEKQLTIPKDFLHFMKDKRLLFRVRSHIDAYFELPEMIEEVLPNSKNYLLRFYSDSQYTCFWYLCLDQKGNACVLFSKDLYGDKEEEPGFEKTEHSLEFCAPTFEEFIFRHWIETSTGGKLNRWEEGELTEWEQVYKEKLKKWDRSVDVYQKNPVIFSFFNTLRKKMCDFLTVFQGFIK